MKNIILATSLVAITGAVSVFYPLMNTYAKTNSITQTQQAGDTIKEESQTIDVVFVLDTTGSMGGLIEAAKQKIWSIASTMASSDKQTKIRMGLVAYRDRGDAYITRVVDLTHDLDTAYAELMQFQANGGGDGPEDVNKGLYDAVTKINWSQSADTYKTIFLVGDAPAHRDYQDQMQYPEIIQLAKSKGIVVNSIQCGSSSATREHWLEIAQLGYGEFFQVEQNGGAVAVSTPYDRKIAELSEQLEQTRIAYGDRGDFEKHREKVVRAERVQKKASVEAKARRGLYNISSSGKKNLLGEKDLVDDVVSGKAELDKIKKEHLPPAMQSMDKDALAAQITLVEQQRKDLKAQIKTLGEQRQSFVKEALAKKGGAEDSLDEKLYKTIKKQAKEKGIEYSSEEAAY